MTPPGDATVAAWRVVPMGEDHVEEILSWVHDPPYEFYDFDIARFPDDVAELRDPAFRAARKASVVDEAGDLVGHLEWKVVERVTTIGLGLRPDLTGRGLGVPFVELALDAARARFDVVRFELSVADWNRRAILVYERCGFERTGAVAVVQHHDGITTRFLEMARPA